MAQTGVASQRMQGGGSNPGRRGGNVRGWAARALAVLAVTAAAIALYVVIEGSLSSSGDGDAQRATTTQGSNQQPKESGKPPETYVVQPGDTLGGIADRLNIPVERLVRLNPDVDPQALPSGVTLKLRN